jgi:hypothetical protein
MNEHNINLSVWFYLLPIFIVLKFFKSYIQLIKIQLKHGSFHNETFKSFESIFLCLCWKFSIFKIWIWADVLFGSLYHAWTYEVIPGLHCICLTSFIFFIQYYILELLQHNHYNALDLQKFLHVVAIPYIEHLVK